MTTKVTLRQKEISKGRKSLYLDFYPAITEHKTGGKTRREFLKLYIEAKPKNPLEKLNNKQTLLIAEQIRHKRDNELNKPEVYTAFELKQLEIKSKGELCFLKYYETLMEKKEGKTYDVWFSAFRYLKEFTNNELKFSDVTERLCNDYRDYILTAKKRNSESKIARNTAEVYFNKFKATLKQAYKDDLLQIDLNAKVKTIQKEDTERKFLSMEELNKLANTECINPLLKRASLFSALTGLRFSDIQKLKWKEVVYSKNQGYGLQFQQQKTKGWEYLPISKQAYEIMGEPKEPNCFVFERLTYSAHQNSQLLKWVISAGIQKHITFHSFRHTYATIQLTQGANIVTISKLLGHKEIKTTQIYAKVVDEKKREATKNIVLNVQYQTFV